MHKRDAMAELRNTVTHACVHLLQYPGSGLLHFSRGPPGGPANTERLSAYRFFDEEASACVGVPLLTQL